MFALLSFPLVHMWLQYKHWLSAERHVSYSKDTTSDKPRRVPRIHSNYDDDLHTLAHAQRMGGSGMCPLPTIGDWPRICPYIL